MVNVTYFVNTIQLCSLSLIILYISQLIIIVDSRRERFLFSFLDLFPHLLLRLSLKSSSFPSVWGNSRKSRTWKSKSRSVVSRWRFHFPRRSFIYATFPASLFDETLKLCYCARRSIYRILLFLDYKLSRSSFSFRSQRGRSIVDAYNT